ncbi:hypothetical protein GQ602_002241 [Ophiocordyceps camponoti-floridani]|uniref:Uncharacterized protein n=1 Tax=Ophiocordyceps camponoti-floridani TaxID=2030778 RepID=A0A8H4VF85_9HYPO|nr:hypothetical protein GQ602_002241 [Ophiocordyceps camponoti-floridani]
MPAQSNVWSRRDSWPPTQVRLNPPMVKACSDPRPLLEDIDDNPLTYFLTPSPDGDMDAFGDDDDMEDFDAGIEDASHPRAIVRSVSPSSLEGHRKSSGGMSSLDLDSDVPSTDDDDDDDDDCVRFSPPRSITSRFAPLRTLAIDGLRLRARSTPVLGSGSASYPGPPHGKAHGGRPSRSAQVRPRPTRRLWREPSPDVWSIEEETEEEVLKSETVREEPAIEQKAARPKKRVRFLLPARE